MRVLAPALAAVLLLGASACGDDEPTASSSVAASPSASAGQSDAPTAQPEPSAQSSSAPVADGARLIGDGVDLRDGVVVFGTTYDEAAPRLEAALGPPTEDTGEIEPFSSYGTCPGTTLRVLEYAGGALELLFGDVESDEPVLYGWALTDNGDPGQAPPASALVGDVTTFELRVGVTTVAELQEEVGEEVFQISEDELSLDPAFTLEDQSSGFRGFLTGTSAADTVTFVEAGTPCGE